MHHTYTKLYYSWAVWLFVTLVSVITNILERGGERQDYFTLKWYFFLNSKILFNPWYKKKKSNVHVLRQMGMKKWRNDHTAVWEEPWWQPETLEVILHCSCLECLQQSAFWKKRHTLATYIHPSALWPLSFLIWKYYKFYAKCCTVYIDLVTKKLYGGKTARNWQVRLNKIKTWSWKQAWDTAGIFLNHLAHVTFLTIIIAFIGWNTDKLSNKLILPYFCFLLE